MNTLDELIEQDFEVKAIMFADTAKKKKLELVAKHYHNYVSEFYVTRSDIKEVNIFKQFADALDFYNNI